LCALKFPKGPFQAGRQTGVSKTQRMADGLANQYRGANSNLKDFAPHNQGKFSANFNMS
jgi:hypothetical protein